MKTFNGSKKLKKELLTKLKHHQELDAFIQGQWITDEKVEGNGFKGCFYGCTMQTEDQPREKFSEKYNIDLWYCYITEKLFENLPKGAFETFPYQSIEVLPVGFDFNKAKSLFHYKLLENYLQFANGNKDVENAIKVCMQLFKVPFNEIEGAAEAAETAWAVSETLKEAAWSVTSPETIARTVVECAAWSAESAKAAKAAEKSAGWAANWASRSTADSAARAVDSAVWSANWASRSTAVSGARVAMSAARAKHYVFVRDLLFNCIKESK